MDFRSQSRFLFDQLVKETFFLPAREEIQAVFQAAEELVAGRDVSSGTRQPEILAGDFLDLDDTSLLERCQ